MDPTLLIRRYTNQRAIIALLALMMLLELVFILRIFKPDTFKLVLDNHIFELVVLLSLAQMILLLFRLLDRAPGRVCQNEHECEVRLRAAIREDTRVNTLHVFSCGLGSRLDMVTSIHQENKGKLSTEVLVQSPAAAVDRQDAQRTETLLRIVQRDHYEAPLEIRLFDTPATIRALLLCDDKRKPLWGVVSWYKYDKSKDMIRVVGRRNPAIVLRGYDSAEDQVVLNFLMGAFEQQWPLAARL